LVAKRLDTKEKAPASAEIGRTKTSAIIITFRESERVLKISLKIRVILGFQS